MENCTERSKSFTFSLCVHERSSSWLGFSESQNAQMNLSEHTKRNQQQQQQKHE